MSQSLDLHPKKDTKNHGNPTNPFQSYRSQKEEWTNKSAESFWIKGYLGGVFFALHLKKSVSPIFANKKNLENIHYYLKTI